MGVTTCCKCSATFAHGNARHNYAWQRDGSTPKDANMEKMQGCGGRYHAWGCPIVLGSDVLDKVLGGYEGC